MRASRAERSIPTTTEVVCVAHVTNTMAAHGDDFEKGDDNGTHRILALVDAIVQRVVQSE
jgi:hypothetical protein